MAVRSVDRAYGREHFIGMIGDFNAAPDVSNDAVTIDYERAALDADMRAPVHVLFLHHVVSLAQGFVGIGKQF